MRRYFFGQSIEPEVEVSGDVFHHIVKVVRHRVGENVELLDGNGGAATIEITEIGKRSLIGRRVSQRELPQVKEPFIFLAVSVPKLATLEWILEKSVEQGVHTVYPFFSQFSFFTNAQKLSSSRWQRFERIIQAATEQCGRGDLMNLHQPLPLTELVKLEEIRNSQCFIADVPLGQERTWKMPRRQNVTAVVGPEGGFAPGELEEIPGQVIRLGDFILRTETACVDLVARLKQELKF